MSLEQAEQSARRILNLDPIIARLGYGNGNIYDLTVPGNYFVRKIEAGGNLSQPFSLPLNPLASIPVIDGAPVLLGYDLFGTFCIYSAHTEGLKTGGNNPLILNPLDTAVYGKTSQTNLATLYYQRHADTTNFPFTIVVFKAPVIINGIADFFAGAGINVSNFVPSTGLHCYVSVFLRTDMTLEAFASTPTNLLDPLTVAVDVQECIGQSSTKSVIICSYELRDTDTLLSPDPTRNIDMRQIVNTDSSGTGSTLPNFGAGVIKTLSSDIVAAGSDRHLIIAAESGTADNLIEITGLNIGDEVIIRADSGDTITVKNDNAGATDKIFLYNAADLAISGNQTLKLNKIASGKVVQYVDEKGSGASDFPTFDSINFDESYTFDVSNTPITQTYQPDSNQINGMYFFQNSTPATGDYFTLPLFLANGSYTCYVIGVPDVNRGKLDWDLDGASQTTGQDWYNAGGTQHNIIKTFSLTVSTDGNHVLKGTINGKNAGSSNYYWALTKIWVR